MYCAGSIAIRQVIRMSPMSLQFRWIPASLPFLSSCCKALSNTHDLKKLFFPYTNTISPCQNNRLFILMNVCDYWNQNNHLEKWSFHQNLTKFFHYLVWKWKGVGIENSLFSFSVETSLFGICKAFTFSSSGSKSFHGSCDLFPSLTEAQKEKWIFLPSGLQYKPLWRVKS